MTHIININQALLCKQGLKSSEQSINRQLDFMIRIEDGQTILHVYDRKTGELIKALIPEKIVQSSKFLQDYTDLCIYP